MLAGILFIQNTDTLFILQTLYLINLFLFEPTDPSYFWVVCLLWTLNSVLFPSSPYEQVSPEHLLYSNHEDKVPEIDT